MKQTLANLFLLLFFLAGSPVWAQSTAIITGKISKPLSEEITAVNCAPGLVTTETEIVATLKGGQFRLEVPVSKPGLAELVHGTEVLTLYVEPGFELHLTANGDKLLKTAKFEGAGASENNYLAQYAYAFEELEQYQVLPDNIKLREKAFLSFLESRKQEQLKFLEKFIAKTPLSLSFHKLAQAEIDFGYANDRIMYFDLREQTVRSENRLTPSPAYYDYLQTLNLQEEANIHSPTFTGFISNYTRHLAIAAGKAETSPDFYSTSYHLARQKLTGPVQSLALSQILKQSFLKGYAKQSADLLTDFQTLNQDQELLAYLQELSQQNRQLTAGTPAPDFKLQTATGEEVALSDFKGKLVYLSFWSTSCGMCINDMPYLQELHNKLDSENLVFISVGMDEDETAWRNMITNRRLPGVQLYKGLSPDLLSEYAIKDLPAYFLVDEAGNVLTTKPKRPTNRDAETELLRLLHKGQASAK
ncbi:AhpC/TSA family protein [Pontibacter qinzhouensis]|uniref:AhpC/TSA family protein n=1 Tax=Pontibacter qinzhouensis TaxID=2603253 RepID=A0A5C8KC38_9BACT|nr:TlpA disulfide reductase family protein [Pontibacter qinzhouensis]TXK51335.1 AhpC/TSA family protein [Pontibacter qinzhouensis]